MAVVTLLGSLASGMPLASMFKVYTYIMCEVYDPTIRDEPIGHGGSFFLSAVRNLFLTTGPAIETTMKLPPAPELPNPPRCSLPWVQKSTSSYSAAMVTVGALLGLMTLSRASTLSRRFGRKPLLLIAHAVIALAILVFRFAVVLPPVAGAVVLYCAVVFSEASAGAPLRIAIQNYVVDTTSEAQRAGALSFIEGFGQIGAFPSSALGGLLASLTNEFFAPFYADCGLMLLAVAYILLLVPESKPGAEHTFVDQWLHSDEVESGSSQEDQEVPSPAVEGDQDGEQDDSHMTWPTVHSDRDTSKLHWRSRLRKLNFLRPLVIFWPQRRHYTPTTEQDIINAPLQRSRDQRQDQDRDDLNRGQHTELTPGMHKLESRMDFRLLNLAAVVVFEETYQAFMVPLLLLYNSERFGFDVLQNGYLVSVLQSTRALFLTAIFPPGVALARRYVAKLGLARRRKQIKKLKEAARQQRRKARGGQSGDGGAADRDERSPLLRNGSSSQYDGITSRDYGRASSDDARIGGEGESRQARRRPSYKSTASPSYSKSKSNQRSSMASGFSVGSRNWETHSIFTSSASDLIKRIQRGKLDISIMVASYLLATASFLVMASSAKAPTTSPRPSSSASEEGRQGLWWSSPWIPLVLSVVLLQISSGSTSVRTALVVNAVSEDDQTKALAAHQILVTVVAAVVPLLTSFVFGVALERGHPEMVWLFKAMFAALAAVGAVGLFWSHKGFYEKAHDEEDEHDDDDDDDEDGEGEGEERR
uniref:Major facilitator superfamily (MFS) profile domain-containing protein n=2 Tax=Kalmanozyma brasiliensis (strain GHG001) TaxID=1365824 RepID=V5ERZ2_KALBG